MSQVIAIAGATGFVGRHAVRELLGRGLRVRALVRDLSRASGLLGTHQALSLVEGEAERSADRESLLRGASACINAIGIIRESASQTFRVCHTGITRGLVEGCEALGVGRFVQVSALGVGDEGNCSYRQSKFEAEMIVRRSDLAWTILRPGMILGAGSGFLEMARGWVTGKAFPHVALPYFKRHVSGPPVPGLATLEDPAIAPVSVLDVARAIGECLGRPGTEGEVIDLVGPESTTMPAILKSVKDSTPLAKRWLRLVPLPHSVGVRLAKLARPLGFRHALPFDEGMARIAGEDSVARRDKAESLLGFEASPVLAHLPTFMAGR
ncbi:MAG: NAD(P)H-binding protein [Phycisphaerales bacterium]|nr:NAD(P)H-binding protein [Phycisphaerales bacterium]